MDLRFDGLDWISVGNNGKKLIDGTQDSGEQDVR
jgi:hypothetical protein